MVNSANSNDVTMQKIVSLAKRRGFVFPGSEIYGGLANTYDMGPLGVEMLRNITSSWWKRFVHDREDMFGLDTSILMSPKVWEASGHTKSFTDALIDCKSCKNRTRADHLIEDSLPNEKVEGKSMEELAKIISENKLKCPNCGEFNWTEPRKFNLLFETHIGIIEESQSLAYLRGEIAQGMFVNFRNVLETMRPKLPFGIAQSGKAFRNEITLGNFIFRTLEFNLAEFEYFFHPTADNWEKHFEYWKKEMLSWIKSLGIDESKLRWRTHTDEERAHYSTRTEDLDFEFPGGFKEMLGLAYRTDFDLKNHMEKSDVDLRYTDPQSGEKFIPHVVEPTFGINRVLLALLVNGYVEEKERVVLKLSPDVAPYRVAVFPLVRNKDEITTKAREVFEMLKREFNVAWDDRGNIGKRYLSQDEIGTPYCVTIDYDTLQDNTVTVRDRDTMEQRRVAVGELNSFFKP
ncbi:glycine--tRNA ligase [candidate division WWE3 bacterium RIFCSPHIGHO2_01_FULL_42_13]|uniref:glycine--tRNA ligase n=1 Tax=candidate division WWE3 bacterium RIFCSPHIGHO2_01_FULL_42_13 TaxID=1802617 RepID=A0A1F4UQC3_UNCKA|nr:MAG: glycine--tRNA ligase [candidate division WWE3 bacterium RIFCSPHIGHO2_01_FULL_42_13]